MKCISLLVLIVAPEKMRHRKSMSDSRCFLNKNKVTDDDIQQEELNAQDYYFAQQQGMKLFTVLRDYLTYFMLITNSNIKIILSAIKET